MTPAHDNTPQTDSRRPHGRWWLSLIVVPLSACVAVTQSNVDISKLASRWHATLPHSGSTAQLVDWWSSFDDPALSELLRTAEANSPTLESAVAEIEEARATMASSKADYFPSLTGSGSDDRSGTRGSRANRVSPSTTGTGELDASWELDFFGKTRNTVEAARQRVAEETADWYDARVTLAAEVADDYVQYRACRQLQGIYAAELVSQRDTVKATEASAASGLKSTSDLALIRASAASTSSSLKSQEADCEVLIKSITELVAVDEGKVRDILKKSSSRIPRPAKLSVDAIPANVIRQRPDVNALEKEVAASLADIGTAKADLYPSFSLSGTLTASHSTSTGTSLPWSFGPSVSIPIFDGGSLRATVKYKEAAYKAAVASYKSGVLSAINAVETAMVNVNSTERQIGDAVVAAKNYRAYFKAIDTNWKAGGASVLDREDARRELQAAELTLVENQRDAVRDWITLYKAMGGGWTPNASGGVMPSDVSAKGVKQ
ncbi:efflux transporter outer membrane subunit [Agrobacterium vitis]|uniref:efflux transporter outer membrane subunit n=1 Tax=Agrobacterium vitis TaxID=373 RepID=UPI0012E8A1B6|nr:efflux transporter outer membrane subunit [Agrobacterium vitis]MVA38135.1 efflux transporter outer membrane subunit [Agrobacterium vitis]